MFLRILAITSSFHAFFPSQYKGQMCLWARGILISAQNCERYAERNRNPNQSRRRLFLSGKARERKSKKRATSYIIGNI